MSGFGQCKANTLSFLFIIWRNIEAILASIYELIAKAASLFPSVSYIPQKMVVFLCFKKCEKRKYYSHMPFYSSRK